VPPPFPDREAWRTFADSVSFVRVSAMFVPS
jgi:hypothetical protein